MLKDIDLTNKCGSCCHFKPIEDTVTGECLQNPYNDSIVHDPKHPHWIVQRSRIKCQLYNAKPQTNADRLRTMSDENLAIMFAMLRADLTQLDRAARPYSGRDVNNNFDWLKQPTQEEIIK